LLLSQQNKTKIIGLIVVVLISTTATAGVVYLKNTNIPKVASLLQTPAGGSNSASTNTTTTSSSTTYKDGTYTATGQFYTPEGSEQIGVTIALANNKVTSVSIDSSSIQSRTSYEYTALFADNISNIVVGKNINDASVSYVSGASLTPIGFDNALETIKNNAKA
jgi:uncharacterized protein with FMN-binding domain